MGKVVAAEGVVRFILTRCGKTRTCDICDQFIMRSRNYIATWRGAKQVRSEHCGCYKRRKEKK